MPYRIAGPTVTSSFTPLTCWSIGIENVLWLPLETRRKLLTDAPREVEYPVLLSTQFDCKPIDLIHAAKGVEFEDVIASAKARSMNQASETVLG